MHTDDDWDATKARMAAASAGEPLPYPEVALVDAPDDDPGNEHDTVQGLVGDDEPDDLEAEDAIEEAKADPGTAEVT